MELLNQEDAAWPRCEERVCFPHRELSALYATSEILATRTGSEMLLEPSRCWSRKLGMMRGTVMLLAPDAAELAVAAAHNVDGELQQTSATDRGRVSPAKWSARAGRSVIPGGPRAALPDRVYARSGVS